MITRRQLLQAGGLWLAGLALPRRIHSAGREEIVEITMRSDIVGTHVSFDPIGVRVRAGQLIRWVNDGNSVHTATAYHPANDRHALRIPRGAQPWDSGYLVNAGDRFELRLTVPGIYDYHCRPHEASGMVGRIVVTDQTHATVSDFADYPADPGGPGWRKIPEDALAHFPAVQAILAKGSIPAGG